MSEIQAAMEKIKNNRAAVKKVLAVMLTICDIHHLKETVAELGSNAWEKKEIPPAHWKHKIVVKMPQNGITGTMASGNE